MKHQINYCILILVSAFAFGACSREDETPIKAVPTSENIEIGLGNNEMAVIGEDFHFEADITAGDKLAAVELAIRQLPAETYSGPWSYEVIWEEYKDLKNANVHKHFDIPDDAVEGKYEVVITILDQNGESQTVTRNLMIYKKGNVPQN